MNFWDHQFSYSDYKYGTLPNTFLVEQAHRIPPAAHVLLPGDGEGRNSVWLAQQGLHVCAMDGSSVGLDKARALAAERGVTLTTVHADFTDWVPDPACLDAVVLTFVHLPPDLRRTVHHRLAAALRPGGVLILEAFHPMQLNHLSGGPKDSAMLYTPDTLRADWAASMSEELAWEGPLTLDEGPGHQGLAHITRWVGCKR
jgi:SAM-dependent methyltransferase